MTAGPYAIVTFSNGDQVTVQVTEVVETEAVNGDRIRFKFSSVKIKDYDLESDTEYGPAFVPGLVNTHQ